MHVVEMSVIADGDRLVTSFRVVPMSGSYRCRRLGHPYEEIPATSMSRWGWIPRTVGDVNDRNLGADDDCSV